MKMKQMLTVVLFPALMFAKHVNIAEGGISFDSPDGFTKMSHEMAGIKYPKGNPPSFVLTNQSTETTIAYGLKNQELPQEEIAMTGKAFEQVYRRVVGGFELHANKVVRISGQKWIQMEFTSNTIDSKVYNIFLVTGAHHKMYVLNINATLKEFPTYEKALRKCIKSIKLSKSTQ